MNTNKQEKIVCAALKITWTGVLKLEHDVILCGPSYDFIRRNGFYMNLKYGEFKETVNHEKGFITNKNRFVDPNEAMQIAVDTKVVSDLYFKKKILELILSREHIPVDDHIRTAKGIPISNDYDDTRKRLKDINDRIDRGLLPEDLY